MAMPAEPMFPFMDLAAGRRWTLRPNPGRIPWWVLSRKRRAPGTHATDHLALLRLRRITDDATVAASLRNDTFYHRLIEPLAVAALNTPPDIASGAAAACRDARDAFAAAACIRPFNARAVGEPSRSR
jgi:hypothetical protein